MHSPSDLRLDLSLVFSACGFRDWRKCGYGVPWQCGFRVPNPGLKKEDLRCELEMGD
jgi:hypothetical protein